MTGSGTDALAQLEALQRDYAARLPGKAAELATRFAALRDRWCPTEANELRRLVHNLAGSGASYGFPAVSAEARRAERALDDALSTAPTAAALDAIDAAFRALAAATSGARRD